MVVLVALGSACTLDASGTRAQDDTTATTGGAAGGGGMPGTGGAAGVGGAAGGGGEGSCTPSPETCNGVDEDCNGLIDDQAECPCEHRTFEGHAYLFCAALQTWTAARDACSALHYHLVTIDSQAENDFIFSTARNQLTFDKWFIGFNDQDTEDTWVWVDGSPVTYTNWRPDDYEEPNGGSGENCAEMGWYSDATWDDYNCNTTRQYVCEAGGR